MDVPWGGGQPLGAGLPAQIENPIVAAANPIPQPPAIAAAAPANAGPSNNRPANNNNNHAGQNNAVSMSGGNSAAGAQQPAGQAGQAGHLRVPSPPPGAADGASPIAENWCYTQVSIFRL